MMMRLSGLIVFAALIVCGHADARPGRGGGAVPYPCSLDLASGIDSDCAAADKTALVIYPNLLTTARQSSQTFSGSVVHDMVGITYPTGNRIAEASMGDPIASASSLGPGCNYDASNLYIRCNTTSDIRGYKWNDVGLFMAGTGSTYLRDNAFYLGPKTCRAFSGLEPVRLGGGVTDTQYNVAKLSPECDYRAYLYGKAGKDPGLASLASANITIASDVLTFNGAATGTFRAFSYLDYSGISQYTRTSGNVAPGVQTISSITISAGIATVTTAAPHGLTAGAILRLTGQSPNSYSGVVTVASVPTGSSFTYAIPPENATPGGSASSVGVYAWMGCTGSGCTNTQWAVCKLAATSPFSCGAGVTNATSVAATFGPIEPNANAAFQHLAGTHGGSKIKNNAVLYYPTILGDSSGDDIDHSNNLAILTGCCGEHNNLMVQQPATNSPETPTLLLQNNVEVIDSSAQPGFTSGITAFLTSNTQNSSSGSSVDWAKIAMNRNVVIPNKSVFNNGNITNTVIKTLQQGTNIATVAASGTSMSGGIWTTGTVTGSLTVGDSIECDACSGRIKILSNIDATHWNIDSSQVIALSANWRTRRYPGTITVLEIKDNAIGVTGADAPFSLDGSTTVGSSTISGNINLESGGACTPASCP